MFGCLTALITGLLSILYFRKKKKQNDKKWIYYRKKFFITRIKEYLMRIVLYFRSKPSHIVKDSISLPKQFKKAGRIDNPKWEEKLESIHDLPTKYSLDSYYFTGTNKDGTTFVLRICRRANREAEVWVIIRDIKKGILLEHPIHPQVNHSTDTIKLKNENPFDCIKAGGLIFQCMEPMKRWRVSYDGMLRIGKLLHDQNNNNQIYKLGEFVHVRFDFHWTTFTECFNFNEDLPHVIMAKSIANQPWSRSYFDKLKKSQHQIHYEQFGQLKGFYSLVNEKNDEKIDWIELSGMRDHSFGIRHWNMFHRYITHIFTLDDGSCGHLSFISMESFNHLVAGYIFTPNGTKLKIIHVQEHIKELGENGIPPDQYTIHFKTDDLKKWKMNVKITEDHIEFYLGKNTIAYERLVDIIIDDHIKGNGITEFMYNKDDLLPPESWETLPALNHSINEKLDLFIPFDHPLCCYSDIVGGKGAQLGVLYQFQNQFNEIHSDFKFTIPEGFVLSIFLHDKLIKPILFDIQIEIKKIEKLFKKNKNLNNNNDLNEQIQISCKNLQNFYQSLQFSNKLMDEFVLFINNYHLLDNDQYISVRSSAIYEDGSSASSAGQFDTFLGLQCLDDIIVAIKNCWASQYSFRAVSYRFLNGQPLFSSMGVCIQRLIHSKSAGVCFTSHPISGERNQMVISANYGLGVSVVDGTVNPDEFTIKKSNYCNNNHFPDNYLSFTPEFSIQSKQLGNKQTKNNLYDDEVQSEETTKEVSIFFYNKTYYKGI